VYISKIFIFLLPDFNFTKSRCRVYTPFKC